MPAVIHDILIYMLCFVGIFTSVIFFLTIFSPKKKKYELDPKYRPKITIVIPVYNEGGENGKRLKKTLDSLLDSNYPREKLEIIVVNDGSTDNSLKIVRQYTKYGVKIISYKKSIGKTRAINKGIRISTGELVAGLDADSYLMPDVLEKLVPCFKDKHVMAAIPSIKIAKPTSIIQYIQSQEFLSSVFIRHIQSELGGIPMAPGAFTLVRRSFTEKHGLLDEGTMVEDLELSLRIQSEGYLIENVVNANVYTSGVKTMRAFVNQRIRWFCGFIRQMTRYRHLIHPKYGNLGVFILPIAITYTILALTVFCYTTIMIIDNLAKWIKMVALVGIDFSNLFEFKLDIFYITLDNTTVLPIILFFILLMFIFYIKRESEEKQGILLPFFIFTFTYWLLGPICWVIALYHYVTHKKIKWGPNYFTP